MGFTPFGIGDLLDERNRNANTPELGGQMISHANVGKLTDRLAREQKFPKQDWSFFVLGALSRDDGCIARPKGARALEDFVKNLRTRVWGSIAAFLGTISVAAADDNIQFGLDGSMPYLAFEKLEKTKIKVPGGTLDVRFAPGELKLEQQKMLDWIQRSARAVAIFYGKYPVQSARILIVPDDGAETSGGQAFGNAGAAVRLFVGRDISNEALAQDWQLPHEMVHLTFPTIPKSTWLTEGLAVYVEPIARVQAGDLTPEYIWADFAKLLPTGLPKPGDKGLDKAEERQRIYEGGALFWLMADLEIRKRTQNRVGVQDALRGVLDAGGTIEQVWSAERTLTQADKTTGQKVLTEFRENWRANAVSPDLDQVWRDLGIKISGENVIFDDTAPLADVRRAITARRPLN